jgi:TolB-like protein/Flp pilus assembly protein TadD
MTREFRVGDWLVEPDLNRVSKADKTIQIEPKVIEVLVCMANKPGEVLSKKEIMRSVWHDTYVGEDVLLYAISTLRRALGDDARSPHLIETIPRRGYRLIAPVTHAAPPKPQPVVAILAFADMSAEKDQEHFCDGISEEITANLSRVRDLRVVARTSAFAFKGRCEDVRTIGRSLGASAVLEGSVRKSGNQLRITAQLTSAEDGCHLWSARYDRELKDVFAIQDEIARNIATALKIALSPGETDAARCVPTTDLQAYDYYLRGRQFFFQYKRRGVEFALRMFSQAIELDPRFARAYAGIAECCAFLYLYAGSHDSHRQQADSASRTAVELDPESAEGHVSRGVAMSLKEAHGEADREFEIAVSLDPNLFDAYYFHARTAFVQGRLEKAIELYEKASQVNPHDYQAPLLVAQIYADLGRHAEAEAARLRGLQAAEARLKLFPDDARALYMGANGLVALGRLEQGLEWAGQALTMDPGEPMVLYNVACIQSLAGRVEDAVDCLERAVATGLTQKSWLDHDSNLDPLRQHPRFQALMGHEALRR